MRKSNAKKKFYMSAMALILSIAMLIGTTFAWFSDSVTSGKNTITAGNLDIEVYHTSRVQETEEKIDGQTDLFKDVTLWEPGAISWENFTVKNVGTLAAKYSFNLNIAAMNSLNGHNLSEVIKVAVVDNGIQTGFDRTAAQGLTYETLADFQKSGVLAATTGEAKYGIVLYWEPTDNDNLYNVNNGEVTSDNGDVLFIDFGVAVQATQNTVEEDSFDDQYDVNATLAIPSAPIVGPVAEDVVIHADGQVVKSATVPKDAVNTLFDEMKDPNAQSNTLRLDFVPEPKGSTETSITYDITMYAVMTSVKDGITSVTKKSHPTLDDYAFVDLQLDTGLLISSVMHSDKAMHKTAAEDTDGAGYYTYNGTTGILTLYAKSFSPFVINYTKPKFTVDSNAYETFDDAWAALGNNSTLTAYQDFTINTTKTIEGLKNVTIDFGGKTVTANMSTERNAFDLTGTSIIVRNGSIISKRSGIVSGGGVELQNLNITANKDSLTVVGTQEYAVGVYGAGIVTITSGSYFANKGATLLDVSSQSTTTGCFAYEIKSSGGKIIMNGGTLGGDVLMDGRANKKATLEINSGTISNAVVFQGIKSSDNTNNVLKINNNSSFGHSGYNTVYCVTGADSEITATEVGRSCSNKIGTIQYNPTFFYADFVDNQQELVFNNGTHYIVTRSGEAPNYSYVVSLK